MSRPVPGTVGTQKRFGTFLFETKGCQSSRQNKTDAEEWDLDSLVIEADLEQGMDRCG